MLSHMSQDKARVSDLEAQRATRLSTPHWQRMANQVRRAISCYANDTRSGRGTKISTALSYSELRRRARTATFEWNAHSFRSAVAVLCIA